MSFVKIYMFQKGRAERCNNIVRYVENNVFLNLKLRKHQIHQIMFFLETSYDPFNHKTKLLKKTNLLH